MTPEAAAGLQSRRAADPRHPSACPPHIDRPIVGGRHRWRAVGRSSTAGTAAGHASPVDAPHWAIFERARRSGGAQHSTERSRLRPDQRAHNRGHSVRDACFLMGAVRLVMNLPSPRQLPAQAQCNATDQFEGANSTGDCVRSGTPPVLLKPLWAGSAHVVQFRPVVIE